MGYLNHGSSFKRPDNIATRPPTILDPWREYQILEKVSPDCAWNDCRRPRFFDMPVCQGHAKIIQLRLDHADYMETAVPIPKTRRTNSWVYYLMVGPKTVKIGSTICLRDRLVSLRTEPQYVAALETGGYEQENKRHRQFAEERHGRLENFNLSDRLIAHVTELQPTRDELMVEAMNPKLRYGVV